MTEELRTVEALDAIQARLGERSAQLIDALGCIIGSLILLRQISARPEVAAEVSANAIGAARGIAKLLEIDDKEISTVCRMMAADLEDQG